MGDRILVQPDGLLAVWSTTTDEITMRDCTEQELTDYWVGEAASRARVDARHAIDMARRGIVPRPTWPPNWATAVASHEKRHGPLEDAAWEEVFPGGDEPDGEEPASAG